MSKKSGVGNWEWAPSIEREFDRWGLRWEVVEALTDREVGSSPGGCYVTGDRVVVFERGFWEPWVVHELAHFIVTQRDDPRRLDYRNWGTDEDAKSAKHAFSGEDPFFKCDEVALEEAASTINVALLILLRLPWHAAANQLDIVYGDQSSRSWSRIGKSILTESIPYLGEMYRRKFEERGISVDWSKMEKKCWDWGIPVLIRLQNVRKSLDGGEVDCPNYRQRI